jgi:hypothetical protein
MTTVDHPFGTAEVPSDVDTAAVYVDGDGGGVISTQSPDDLRDFADALLEVADRLENERRKDDA